MGIVTGDRSSEIFAQHRLCSMAQLRLQRFFCCYSNSAQSMALAIVDDGAISHPIRIIPGGFQGLLHNRIDFHPGQPQGAAQFHDHRDLHSTSRRQRQMCIRDITQRKKGKKKLQPNKKLQNKQQQQNKLKQTK